MQKCPVCKSDLTQTDRDSGRCAICKAILEPDKELKPSSPENDKLQSIANLKNLLATYVERTGGPVADDKAADEKNDQQKPASAANYPTAEFDLTKTPPEVTPLMTPLEETHQEEPQSTKDTDRTAVTLDLSKLPTTPMISPGSTNLGDLSSSDAARLTAMWGGSLKGDYNPRVTIKAGSTVATTGSHLIIKSRALRKTSHAGASSADYELLNVIGEGGMGIVYAARQASIDRTVALKMLKADYAEVAEQRDKFLSEAVVTGDLDHPNIVPIYDLGTNESGALFYAMKRVRGTPWVDAIEKKSQPENIEILMKVIDAIAFAHSRGVIHRDLKPENVMLGDFGEVLVMDWGLAMATPDFHTSKSISQSGSMGGTPAYMAPEMATGPIEAIGASSDIYLLGAVLFEIITGIPPHTGQNVMKCVFAAAKNEIQATNKTGELVDIAMKAMATNPKDRYEVVQDFQQAIREYQSHSESVALSTRAEEDLQDAKESDNYEDYSRALFGYQEALILWEDNVKAKPGLAAVQLAYAESALNKADFDLGLSLLNIEEVPEHRALQKKLVFAQKQRDAHQQRLKNVRRTIAVLVVVVFAVVMGALLFVNKERQVANQSKEEAVQSREAAVESGKIAEKNRKTAVDLQKEAEDLQRKAVGAKIVADKLREVAEIAKDEQSKLRMEALKENDKQKYHTYITTMISARSRLDENGYDGARDMLRSFIGYPYRGWEWGRLWYLCGLDDKTYKAPKPIDNVVISSDGKRFAAACQDGNVYVWGLGEDAKPITLWHGKQEIQALAFSIDGKYIVSGGSDLVLRVWRLNGADQKAPLFEYKNAHSQPILNVHFSANGRWLLSTSKDQWCKVWDFQNIEQPVLTTNVIKHNWWIWDAVFLLNSQQMITVGQDGKAILWQVDEQGKFKQQREFMEHRGAVYCIAKSPTQNLVATAGEGKRILLWNPQKVPPFSLQEFLNKKNKKTPTMILEGHTASIQSLAFSPDGKLLVSGSNDNTARVWDVASGKLLLILRGHGGQVRACAFRPYSNHPEVLTAGHDSTIKRWDLAGYTDTQIIKGHALSGHYGAIMSATYSPDGKFIATSGKDGTARVWSTDTGKFIKNFNEGHSFQVARAIFLPGGSQIITAAVDNSVRLWDIDSGAEINGVFQGTGRSTAVAYSHLKSKNPMLLTGGEQHKAKLWKVAGGGSAHVVLSKFPAEVTSVAISPDDRWLFAADAIGTCRLFDAKTLAQLWEARHHRDGISEAQFLPDGNHLLIASRDGTVSKVMRNTGKEITTAIFRNPASRSPISNMSITGDGRLAMTNCEDGTAQLWDADRSRWLGRLKLPEKRIIWTAFSPTDYRCLTVTSTFPKNKNDAMFYEIQLWDLDFKKDDSVANVTAGDHFKPLTTIQSKGVRYISAEFSLDGHRVITLGGRAAKIWNINQQKEMVSASPVISFRPHDTVAAVRYSPDGKLLATASWNGEVKIWDIASGHVLKKLTSQYLVRINSVEFHPHENNPLVIVAGIDRKTSKSKVLIWDRKSGKVLWSIPIDDQAHHQLRSMVNMAIFSPDGKYILTASETAQLWYATDGKEMKTNREFKRGDLALELKNHDSSVLCLAFSPDGSRIATGSADKTARIWDAITGKQIAVLGGHTADVTSIAFSKDPEGSRLITGSNDRTAKLWDGMWRGNPGRFEKEILTLRKHQREITSVAFSPGGRSLLTAGQDEIGILWLTANMSPGISFQKPEYEINATGKFMIAQDAMAFDPDTETFDQAQLSIHFPEESLGDSDQLRIHHQGSAVGEISVQQKNIYYRSATAKKPVQIGQIITQPSKKLSLQVQFNQQADIHAVRAVLKNVEYKFQTSQKITDLLKEVPVVFRLTDGDQAEGEPSDLNRLDTILKLKFIQKSDDDKPADE